MTEFKFVEILPLGKDTTEYRLLSRDFVSLEKAFGKDFLKIDPQALTLLAKEALFDASFYLRTRHLEKLAKILEDPESSDNDRFVATTLLKNAAISAKGVLPMCQDTGTVIVHAKKGQEVYTGVNDDEALSKGIYQVFQDKNLRYSQLAPLTMFTEKNTGTNLPAQIEIAAVPGNEYKFLFVAKGGGSANKSFLFQESKALLNENSLIKFFKEKLFNLGTAACPPYHFVIVIGGF